MAPNKEQGNGGSKDKAVSDEEVRQESSKAANASMNAQKKAKELRAAAEGAGDPDERQKLMEQAIDAQVEAESFGKTAKYMRSGAFQGMAVGTGLGVAPGATLGAVTGTLVGGVTSTITGGLGGGIGTAAGAIHGPMVNLGELAGKGVRKVTGNLPGWVASDEQKQALERMMSQVQEEDMPNEDELKTMHEEGGSAVADKGWVSSAKSMASSMGGGGGGDGSSNEHSDSRKKPRKLETKPKESGDATEKPASERKTPRKLETRSGGGGSPSAKDQDAQRRERILREMLREHGVSNEEIDRRLKEDASAQGSEAS